jgi:hypothetical protein
LSQNNFHVFFPKGTINLHFLVSLCAKLQDGPGAVAFKGDADVRGGVVSGEVRLRRAGNEATVTGN